MLKQYFTIAIRNLLKQKGLAFINIFGLSIGIACFSLFLLYGINEFNFDRLHKNADHIFRVYRNIEAMGDQQAEADVYMPMPLGPALKQDFADVEEYVRMKEAWRADFIKADDKISKLEVSFADPNFFSMFSFPLKKGNPKTVLTDAKSLVITEETAQRLFGNADPIGKTVELKLEDKFEPFIVTGVAKAPPANSSIIFKAIGNYNYLINTDEGKRSDKNWHRSSYPTYVRLRSGSKLYSDTRGLTAFRKKYYPGEEAELRKAGYWKADHPPITFAFQPMKSVHTNTQIFGGQIEPVAPKSIWILISIAAGVLLIACINFTTLAIGRSAGRSKEVGIRKVVGGRKKELILQFLLEALLLAIISAMIGLAVANLLLPFFNKLSGRELSFSLSQYPELTGLMIALVLAVGLIAGSYPALVLSGFNPINVLKQKIKVGGSNIFTRSLVTLQFVVSVGLIISTLVILQQLHFMRSKNPGFNKENVIVVNAEGTDSRKVFPIFKQTVSAMPEVAGVAGAELGLGEGTGWSRSGFEYKGKQKEVYEYYIDQNYLPVLGMKLLAGRNFDNKLASDSVTSVIINEAMMNDFGWTLENAVGQPLTGYTEKAERTPLVIGVVKNFNFRPLKEKIQPQMFQHFADYTPFKYFVRIKSGDPSEVLAKLQLAWKKAEPELPFNYSFLDEDLDHFYKAEQRWSSIVGWAGGVSIFLACLGLLGLAALAVVNRTKEIGIRKVLGASVSGIISLISKDFLKLVVVAFIIASPIAWYFMNKWLQDFEYRINISTWIFIIAGAVSILIALVTVSMQAIKAALSNPVKSLRSE
jgi:putative ABC transport system permease protein